MVFSDTSEFGLAKLRSCCCLPCERETPASRIGSFTDSCASTTHDENLLHPHIASPTRLRIRRLMYKSLPHDSCKLDARRHRNRRLVLDKKRSIGPPQSSGVRRAIPNYFQKRLKQRVLVKKCASTHCNTQRTVNRTPSICPVDSSSSNGESNGTNDIETADSITAESKEKNSTAGGSSSCVSQLNPEEAEIKESKPEGSADSLSTIKEYYSLQCSILLLLSMLQERIEEVEPLPKKSNMSVHPAEEESEALKTLETSESFVAANGEDDDGTFVAEPIKIEDPTSPQWERSYEELTEDQPIGSTALNTMDAEPNKENNVPLKREPGAVSPLTTAMSRGHSTSSKEESRDDDKPYSFLEISKSDILDPSYTCDIELEPLENRKRSFVDSLLNKFNLSPPAKPTVSSNFYDGFAEGAEGRRSLRDRTKIAARPRYIEIPEEPRKIRVSKVFGKLHKTMNIDLDCTNSNSSTEFYGFDEGEVVKLDKPRLPGLLPTPIVKKSQPYAPFLAYGTLIETENTLPSTETRSDLFREEGLISFGSLPPRLECPQRPTDMVRPRTVAQKRILVQRENDIRYLIIDNEAKIFRFVRQRSNNIDTAEHDFHRMKELQDQKIPFTRDTWRALAWLRTEKGRYYFQTMTIDNRTVKLSGCRGNHRFKSLTKQNFYSSPVIASRGHRNHYVSSCRCPEYPEGITLNIPQKDTSKEETEAELNTANLRTNDHSRYLCRGWSINDYRNQRSYPNSKPGPLSSKINSAFYHDDPSLGPLEVFHMPPVELEVFPKINRPLDGHIKPYLKMILPHKGITENWARFAVSTLRQPAIDSKTETKILDGDEERSFVFELPYAKNQRHMMIRRRLTVRPGNHVPTVDFDSDRFEELMNEPLSFRAAIDEALVRQKLDKIDPDELVCADILSGITNAVAIALAEDVFLDDDPDIEYDSKGETFRPYQGHVTMPIKIDIQAQGPGSVSTAASPSPSAAVPPNEAFTPDTPSSSDGQSSEAGKSNDPVKSKLLREMKRLNATIIEGPSQPLGGLVDSGRPRLCNPLYCALGCICDVLSSRCDAKINQSRNGHCRQVECMLECKCGYQQKAGNDVQEVQMDLGEKHGGESTSLSSADVKYLREVATARLAKEEREFTPTVILTKNTTVLVRNTESETRRQKKKPKKYDDYYNDLSVKHFLNGGTVDDASSFISKPPANAKPLSASERMRHAHVLLTRMPHLAEIEPLCMVHDLYKCFCEGKATQGKPFSFTEENCVSVMPSSPSEAPVANRTAQPSKQDMLAANSVPSGRMSKGTQSKAKQRMNNQNVADPSPATTTVNTAVVNLRKRLYSFEKFYTETSEGRSRSRANSNAGGKVSGVAHRKQRDSSDESYRPPYEKKSAKKKCEATFEMPTVPSTSGGPIRARRASVAPSAVQMRARRASVIPGLDASHTRPTTAQQAKTGTSAANKRLTLAHRRASLAESTVKPAKNATAAQKSDTLTSGVLDDAQYTVVTPKNSSRATGINNIIIKRIPPTATIPTSAKKQTVPTQPAQKHSLQEMASAKAVAVGSNSSPQSMKQISMSVQELKKLMKIENNRAALEKASTIRTLNKGTDIIQIALVDTEENIDNEPQLNILSDGNKKLVISGNRRAFVANSEFVDGKPPVRTISYPDRSTFVVYIPMDTGDEDDVKVIDSSPAIKPPVKMIETKRINSTASCESSSLMSPSTSRETSTSNGNTKSNGTLDSTGSIETVNESGNQMQSLDPVQQTDRQVYSLMRHINDLLRRKSINLNPPKKGIMHICRWKLLLSAFALGNLDVVDVVLTNGLELTVINTVPFRRIPLPNIRSQISAKQLTIDKLVGIERASLLMKMVVCHVESIRTDDLGLVLYGSDNFWHFCGFLKASEKVFSTDAYVLATPSTGATTKIKARLKDYYRKTFPGHPAGSTLHTDRVSLPYQIQDTGNINTSTIPLNTLSNIDIVLKEGAAVNFPLSVLLRSDPNGFAMENCRWMRLKIENDFSHIYLPSWQCCITYWRIKRAINEAKQLNQPVRLENPVPSEHIQTHKLPYVYALPREGHALFVGPYLATEQKIDLILCQSVQGNLYEREVYEQQNGIAVRTNKRTVGWWIESVMPTTGQNEQIPDAVAKVDKQAEKLSRSAKATSTQPQRSLLKKNNPLPPVVDMQPVQVAASGNVAVRQAMNLSSESLSLRRIDAAEVIGEENRATQFRGSQVVKEDPEADEILIEDDSPADSVPGVMVPVVEGTRNVHQQKKRKMGETLQTQLLPKNPRQSKPNPNLPNGSGEQHETVRKRLLSVSASSTKMATKMPHPSDATDTDGGIQLPSFRRFKSVSSTPSGVITPSNPQKSSEPQSAPGSVKKVITSPVTNAYRTLDSPGQTGQGANFVNVPLRTFQRADGKVPPRALSVAHPTASGAVGPRQRLNSVAVDHHRQLQPVRPQPLDTNEVVCLDDDDDDSGDDRDVDRSQSASVRKHYSFPSLSGIRSSTNTVLSQEQTEIILSQLDLTKSGEQGLYSFDPATRVVKMKRSMLNSLAKAWRDVSSDGGSTSNSDPPPRVPAPGVPEPANPAPAPVKSVSMPRMKVVPRMVVPPTTVPPTTVPQTTVPQTAVPQTAVPPIAFPKMAFPPMTVPPKAVRSKVASGATNGNTVINGTLATSGTVSDETPNVITSLTCITDAQEASLLTEPHKSGVLESNIPRLGYVAAVQVGSQFIIYMKELSVTHQLVCADDMKSVEWLLNRYVHRNTFTFHPPSQNIKWRFKEKALPLQEREKMLNRINPNCVITRCGVIDVSKFEQVEPIKEILPELYQDLLMLRLAKLCFNKQSYAENKCYQDEDRIIVEAVARIDLLVKKDNWLKQQKRSLQQQRDRLKMRKIQLEAQRILGIDVKPLEQLEPHSLPGKTSGTQDGVIVIDDD